MAEGRNVAGIHCMDVLATLNDFVGDELDPTARAQVEAHLRECDWCSQFGGRYADIVRRLRQDLLEEPPQGHARALAAKLLGED